MLYTINELKRKVFSKVYDVYEVFQNFFGEQFTDLQEVPTDEEFREVLEGFEINTEGERFSALPNKLRRVKSHYDTLKPLIYVWWPRVTVTNENGRSVNIQDLYAKVGVTMEGRIPYENRGFLLLRSTYSEEHFTCGYLHSHTPAFSYEYTDFSKFETPCLGSGPINHTILDLKNQYEEALWMLFCQELSLYVTVESLRGGPHFRMENIGNRNTLPLFSGYDFNFGSLISFYYRHNLDYKERFHKKLKEFIIWYLKHGHLSFNFKDGRFVQGMTYFDYIIDISNSFIEWFNQTGNIPDRETLWSDRVLYKVLALNGKFYNTERRVVFDPTPYEGRHVLDFKGREITLHIDSSQESSAVETTLLHQNIAMYVLKNVLKIINYRYRNEHNNKQLESSSTNSTKRNTASPYQRVLYI